jgi:hypothetical protein
VAGIAVTLWVQSVITSRSEEKDTALYLNTLKLEFEENCNIIDSTLIPAMEKTTDYIRYISTHDKRTSHPDTIQSYIYVYRNVISVTYQYDAFEMFKISGNMRFVKDKKLLRSIWSIYANLKMQENWIDNYYREKMEEITKDSQMEAEGKPAGIPMYNFYCTFSNNGEVEYNIMRIAKHTSSEMKEIMSAI